MSSRNELAHETSPYLLQHADNPVAWYPWNETAIERARSEDKPILLSIGYSACHWCHVMAHESFEDEETARVMNEHFVNIKVDREERPDLDKIYQTAHQLLFRRGGGWPLTMFLTPDDHRPFFGGTYFPREPRFGMPAFKELLLKVAEYYHSHREDIREQNERLVQALASLEPAPGHGATITSEPLEQARAQLGQVFDTRHGGFGGAPKFPHATNIERLLRHYAASVAGEGATDDVARAEALFTMSRMALGGIYDQLGGGFCRYSVDDQWMIPHFEKMLYDNGPLLALAAESWQVSGDPLYRRVAAETAAWVMREMQSPEGGYYSTLDADSEGEEGKFYRWSRAEVSALLEDDELRAASLRFGLDRPPNFENEYWHLHVYADWSDIAKDMAIEPEQAFELVERARQKLFEAREQRVHPGRDEKILTAWNGLMIKGMATAGRIFAEPAWIASANCALDFVKENLWRDGRLDAVFKDGRARFPAYLDDYAFMVDATLSLLACRFRREDLDFAVALADVLLEQFEDAGDGGFYFTAHEHEQLIHRPKPFMDDALPSGNGIAAYALARLGHLLGESRYLDAAERTMRAAWPAIQQMPYAHNALLLAVEEHLSPPQIVVVRCGDSVAERWLARASARYAPRRLAIAIPPDESDLPGLLAERVSKGKAVAYVCDGHVCRAPIESLGQLDVALRACEVLPPASA
ncbi:MAG: thioredoxin domain-containing protein [Gammaproteobacteria bacterium]|nr:thioredoxin domain-containing protein [Gammaproteobacteria bacterium]